MRWICLLGIFLLLLGCGAGTAPSDRDSSISDTISAEELSQSLNKSSEVEALEEPSQNTSIEEERSQNSKDEAMVSDSISSESEGDSSVMSSSSESKSEVTSQETNSSEIKEPMHTDSFQILSYPQCGLPKDLQNINIDCFIVTVTRSKLYVDFYRYPYDKGPYLSDSCKLSEPEAYELFAMAQKIEEIGEFEWEEIEDDWDTTLIYNGKQYTSNLDNEIWQLWLRLRELSPIDLTLYGLA